VVTAAAVIAESSVAVTVQALITPYSRIINY
jgi:hypothetical protein